MLYRRRDLQGERRPRHARFASIGRRRGGHDIAHHPRLATKGFPQDAEAIAAVAIELVDQRGLHAPGVDAEEIARQQIQRQAQQVAPPPVCGSKGERAQAGGDHRVNLGAPALRTRVQAEMVGDRTERDVRLAVGRRRDGDAVTVEVDYLFFPGRHDVARRVFRCHLFSLSLYLRRIPAPMIQLSTGVIMTPVGSSTGVIMTPVDACALDLLE